MATIRLTMATIRTTMESFIICTLHRVLTGRWPRHSSGSWLLVSYCGDPSSIPGQVMWDLWWTDWHCGRFPLNNSVFRAKSHCTHPSCGAGIIWRLVADVPSELSLTPPHGGGHGKGTSKMKWTENIASKGRWEMYRAFGQKSEGKTHFEM
jgi:hypothetical protein